MHGMLGMTGFRLFNAPTFLPAYLHLITGSDLHGRAWASRCSSWAASSRRSSARRQIEHRKKVLPVSMLMGTLMRVQMLGVAMAGFFLTGAADGRHPGLPVPARAVLGRAAGRLPAPARQGDPHRAAGSAAGAAQRHRRADRRRSRLSGGEVSDPAACAWPRVSGFNNGYATTFLLAVVLTTPGLSALALLMIEPESPTVRERSTPLQRVKDFPRLLADDRGYFFFWIAQTLATAGRVAAPFYILYAGHSVKLSGETIGLFSLAFLGPTR